MPPFANGFLRPRPQEEQDELMRQAMMRSIVGGHLLPSVQPAPRPRPVPSPAAPRVGGAGMGAAGMNLPVLAPSPSRTDDPLMRMLERHATSEPALPERRPYREFRAPARPQPSGWEILPQLLAGAGDVIAAGGGRRGGHLANVMGIQDTLRERAYRDQMEAAAREWDRERAEREEDRWRFGAEASSRDRAFNRGAKLRELELYDRMMGKSQADVDRQRLEAKITNYKSQLSKAMDRKDLKFEADKLRALNPNDRAAIDAVEAALAGVFDIEAAQPNRMRQQLEASIGRSAGGTIAKNLGAMFTPHDDKGLGIFNAPRGYRWAYAVPGLGTLGAGALDLSELFGLADFSGDRVRLPAPTPQDQARFEEERRRARSMRRALEEAERTRSLWGESGGGSWYGLGP